MEWKPTERSEGGRRDPKRSEGVRGGGGAAHTTNWAKQLSTQFR